MDATAASADGRSIVFEAPLGTPLAPGGFAVVETDTPLLSQITGCEIVARDVDGRRVSLLEGTATALGHGTGGFGGVAIGPAPPDAIAAWADEHLGADGLDVGSLVHAPDVRARLNAG